MAEEVEYPVAQGCIDVEILECGEEFEGVYCVECGTEVHEQDASISIIVGVQVLQDGKECQIDGIFYRSVRPVGELVRIHRGR